MNIETKSTIKMSSTSKENSAPVLRLLEEVIDGVTVSAIESI